uniref:LAGLIDADG homing endonuclease n=1 Tax=Phanerochaete carnosa TaxID=231932 RepID=A0A895KWH3_9APHY|nr:LAGLIDADG homing endonuclease [Phanerochaete carnosa]QRZ60425.1 LAGLIDADG homing endonuclease [Phanerochaete carnosa]
MAWLVGIVEGDGWFSITQNGKYCKYEFGIELHERDIQMLYKLKKALGVGTISLKKDQNKVSFRIRKKPHLKEVILPIFDKYPMISTKHLKYLRFRLNLLNNILYYENLMDYNPTSLTLYENVENLIKLDYFDNWLVGFIEAEGCFSMYKPTSLSGRRCPCSRAAEAAPSPEVRRTGLYNIATFEVSQTNQLPLLKAIKKRLSISSNPYVDKTNNAKLKTTKLDSIQNVINFLDKTRAKLKGHKRLQYLLFLKELRTNPKYTKLSVPKIYGKNTQI